MPQIPSLSESLKKTSPAAGGAAAAAAPVAPSATPKKTTKKSSDRAVAERLAAEMGDSYNPEGIKIGSKSGSIAFIECLGDPSITDKAELKDPKTGKSVTREFARIIGYRFKALEDLEVPDFGATDDFNGDRLNTAARFDWKMVKKGEIFDLTRVEAGALLSKPEFGTVANGGDPALAVQVRASFAKIKGKVESASDLPSISLVLMSGKSIKDSVKIVDVLDYTPPPKGEGASKGPQAGTRVVKPEFKGTKWEKRGLTMLRRGSRGGTRTTKKTSEQARTVAASALFNLIQKAEKGSMASANAAK